MALAVKYTLATIVSFHSYMDTEQYEDAVRDYEKVYQTEKTKGEHISILLLCVFPFSGSFFLVASICCFPPQYALICCLLSQPAQYGKVLRSALKCCSQNLVSLPALNAERIFSL